MIQFLAPEWFLIVPVLIFCASYWKHLRLTAPLRLLIQVLIIALLVRPTFDGNEEGLDLWVIIDRSSSAVQTLGPQLKEWQALLEKSRLRSDRLFYADFASETAIRQPEEAIAEIRGADKSNLATAIHHVLAKVDSRRSSRLLVLSDGYSTEPLTGVIERLISQNISLDYKLAPAPRDPDTRVAKLIVPTRVQLHEAFLVEAKIVGNQDGEVPVLVTRNTEVLYKGSVQVSNGVAELKFQDRLTNPGAYLYRIELQPSGDAFSGNNQMQVWTEVLGPPRILLISPYQPDPVGQQLKTAGFEVLEVSYPEELSVGSLSSVKAVIINNTAANKLAPEFLSSLPFFVEHQGGGLFMIGGEESLGAGGYYGSSIDPLLPVSLELRSEHLRFASAMAIVLDRSGSMSVAVPGGSGLTKMDLADAGAAEAISLLGKHDQVAVLAVDSEAHLVAPLLQVEKNRQYLLNTVRSINSTGGGIYVYEGLFAGWEQLKSASAEQKHIILFADANDAEVPGDYLKLLEEIKSKGGTVSVIGLGTESDVDAHLLKDIAEKGEGRIFFSADPNQLPALFAQDTVAFARSLFVKEETSVIRSGSWIEMSAGELSWLPKVNGYNLTYFRPKSTVLAISQDQYQAPLFSFWQRGSGRVAVSAFPLSGDYSELARQWPEAGNFVQTVVRWLQGSPSIPGIGVDVDINGDEVSIELTHNQDWEEKFALNPPLLLFANSATGEVTEATWERAKPAQYLLKMKLEPGAVGQGAIRIADTSIPFGPISLPATPEWEFNSKRIAELKQISQASGGEQRFDLSKVWSSVQIGARREYINELTILTLIIFIIECLVSRAGWQFNSLSFWRGFRFKLPSINLRHSAGKIFKPSPPVENSTKHPETTIPDATLKKAPTERDSIFRKAKDRGL